MTLNDYVVFGLNQYGLPVLFGVIFLASLGVPLPATLLLLTAGAAVAQGALNLWWVIGLASCAAILGDQLGYAVGRWGSQRVIGNLRTWSGGSERVAHAEQVAQRWGGMGIFLSRWLLTPVGPVLNLTSGAARYAWTRFVCFDVAGEVVWVALYVALGWAFSERVQSVSAALGNVTGVLVALAAVLVLGWQVRQRHLSTPRPKFAGRAS
jgi:membrane protein DedA with SNARE-associated domain